MSGRSGTLKARQNQARDTSVAGKSVNASNPLCGSSDENERCEYVVHDVSEEKIQRLHRMTKNQKQN